MLKKIICLLFILSMISCVTKEEDKISKSSKSASPEENQTPQEPVPSGSSVGDINPTNRVGVQLRAFPYTNEGYSEFPTTKINEYTRDASGKEFYATAVGLVISNSNSGYTTLSAQHLGISSDIQTVFIDSDANIYISSNGGIAVSKDSGSTWTTHEISYHIVKFAQLPNGDVVGATKYDDDLFRTSDGGDTWDRTSKIRDGATAATRGFSDIEVDSNGNIFISVSDGSKGGIYISTDNANTFSRYTSVGLYATSVFVTENDEVYTSTSSNSPRGIFKMSGSVSNPTFNAFYPDKVAYGLHIHNDTFYVATSNEGLLISRSVDSNGDRVWEASGADENTPNFMFDFVTSMNSFNDETYFLGTTSWAYTNMKLGLVKTSDKGVTFEKVISEPPRFYTHGNNVAKTLLKLPNNDLYLLHVNALYKSIDGGVTFDKVNIPTSDDLYGMDIDSLGNIYLLTARRIYKKTPNDTNFTLLKSISPQIHNFFIDASDTLWIGTNNGYASSADNFVTLYSDGLHGYNSTTQTCDLSACSHTSGIRVSGTKRFLRGFRGSSYSLDSGVTWTSVDFDGNGSIDTGDFEINSNGDIYFSNYSYNAMSSDGGQTWTTFGSSAAKKFRFDSNANVYYMSNGTEFCSMTDINSNPTCYGLEQGLGNTPKELIFGTDGIEFIHTNSGLFKFID